MIYIPYTSYVINASHPAAEVESRLQQVVEKRQLRLMPSRRDAFFEGRVENGRFKFNRIIQYRNTFLPLIVGEIKDDLSSARIEVTVRLQYLVYLMLAIMFVIGVSGLVMASAGALAASEAVIGGLLFTGITLFFYVVMMAFFNYEANKARALLREALER